MEHFSPVLAVCVAQNVLGARVVHLIGAALHLGRIERLAFGDAALVDADMHTMDVLDDERRIAEGKTLDAAEVKRRSDEMHDARTQNILRNTDS